MRSLCLVPVLAFLIFPSRLTGQAGDSLAPQPIVSSQDLVRLGIASGVAGLAYLVDDDLRETLRSANPEGGMRRSLADFGDVYGKSGVVGLGAGLWIAGMATRNQGMATVGFRSLEAIGISGSVAVVVKGIAGRARPVESPDDHTNFGFGRGFSLTPVSENKYGSLPSGHAAVSFAFAASVTDEVSHRYPEYAALVGVTTYGAAALTAWSRVSDDQHWVSDVVLGAGIGVVSGLAVTRWHRSRPGNWIDSWFLRPVLRSGLDGSTQFGVCLCPQ